MFKIHDLYRFYYHHPTLGITQCFPANGNIQFRWIKNKEYGFYRKELNSILKFVKDDFKELHKLERSQYRCEKIYFEIHRFNGTIHTLFWKGYLALIDGDFNVSLCNVEIKPRIQDEYNCYLDNWDIEKDFIGGTGAPESLGEIKITEGDLEFVVCKSNPISKPEWLPVPNYEDFSFGASCPENILTWGYNGWVITSIKIPSEDEKIWRLEKKYSREFKLMPCDNGVPVSPGTDWILLENNCPSGSKWVRPVQFNSNTDTTPLKNGRRLKDVITYLISDCGLSVKSKFFSWNAVNDVENIAYEYSKKYLSNLVIFQKSDVRRAKPRDFEGNELPVQQATKAKVVLKKLFESLRNMYGLEMWIDENELNIEHISYSQKNYMLDLTQEGIKERIAGLHKYKYRVEDIPKSETWKWMEQSDIDGDFDGVPIEYKTECSYEKDGKNVEIPITNITTNVKYIIENQDKISNEGFVIVSTNENFEAIIGAQGIFGSISLNMPNALSMLMQNVHVYGRPQRFGKMNNSDVEFLSYKKNRVQDKITVKISPEDLQIFNPVDKVKTQIGWGDVENATLKDPQNILELELLHS